MAPKYIPDGQDFSFPKEFGFSESSRGRHDARNHPVDADDAEYGDGSYVENLRGRSLAKQELAHGGKVKGYQVGGPTIPSQRPAGAASEGPLSRATISMPAADMARAAGNIAQLGRAAGARQAVGSLAQAVERTRGRAPSSAVPGAATAIPAAPLPAPAQQGIPAMATGGKFIQDAVRHPGRMQRGAAREGVSTHQYMEQHKGAPGSLGAAARLGLRMTGGDLSPRSKKG